MGNKLYDIFGPQAEQRIKEQLKKLEQRWIEERCCFVCEHINDISDDRNTCHLCKYTNDLIPNELTCLLWDLNKEYIK
jgi:hypothetical protein